MKIIRCGHIARRTDSPPGALEEKGHSNAENQSAYLPAGQGAGSGDDRLPDIDKPRGLLRLFVLVKALHELRDELNTDRIGWRYRCVASWS